MSAKKKMSANIELGSSPWATGYDIINHRVDNLTIRDTPQGRASLRGEYVTGDAYVPDHLFYPAHDVVYRGKFNLFQGEIRGTIESIKVSGIYEISGISVNARKFFKVATGPVPDDEIMDFFGAMGIFGPGAPGGRFFGSKKGVDKDGTLGDDVFNGKSGNDRFEGSLGNDLIKGAGGRDELFGGANDDRIYGGPGSDALYGDEGDDRLAGNGGGDLILAGAGDDRINGGGGNDQLYGGTGDDRMLGQSGKDFMLGGAGNDAMIGGGGNDRIDGESGHDRLVGGGGNDLLDGGSGYDVMLGGAGRDTLIGGFDDDVLAGGPGSDRLSGGSGDDIFRFAAAGGAERDVITDFFFIQDRIEVTGWNGGYDVAANSQGDAVLTFGDDSITFLGVTESTLRVYMLVDDVFI